MKKKRTLFVFIAIFGFLLIGRVFAIEDNTPPTLNSISLDKNSYVAGESIIISVDAEDDFSGVEGVMLEWCLDEDNCTNRNNLVIEKNRITAQQFEITYTVPTTMLPGNWKFSCIQMWDGKGNGITYRSGDPEINSSLDMTIANDNEIDVEAPVLQSLVVKNSSSAPGSIEIESIITDNLSDDIQVYVNYAVGEAYKDEGQYIVGPIIYYENNVGGPGVQLIKNSEGKYVGILNLNSPDKYVKYVINDIRLEDESNNYVYYSANVDRFREKYGNSYNVLPLPNNIDNEIIPENYEADTTPPLLTSYSYSKQTASIPDTVTVTLNVSDTQSGISYSRVYFKNESGTYIEGFTSTIDYNNMNQLTFRLDFNQNGKIQSDEEIYMYRISLCDYAENCKIYTLDNNDFEKKIISVSKTNKTYTLTTSNTISNYIDQIASLSEGSTVLCNVDRYNQVIKKELFDAIKGKDITVTFESMFSDQYDNTGIQWIINGKDIVYETKDIDMSVSLRPKVYSKYIVSEYKFDTNLENKYFKEHRDEEDMSVLMNGIHELQKVEIEKYFNYLKEQGYKDTDTYLEKTLSVLDGMDSSVKGIIMYANGYVNYLSIDFADNGKLPGEFTIRLKPDYASRNLIGASGLKLYYINGEEFDLEKSNVVLDDEGYYNFTVDHNSSFALSNGLMDTLQKNSVSSQNITVPQTGDNIIQHIILLGMSIIGLAVIGLYIKDKKTN